VIAVERTYMVTIITEAEEEDWALEDQAEMLNNIAISWDMVT
jgi:hypothetical protein